MIVGGLGMGFTLRATLGLLPPGASVTVAARLLTSAAHGRARIHYVVDDAAARREPALHHWRRAAV